MYTIAVGGNKLGARERRASTSASTVIRDFIMCSVFAGLVGIFEAMRTSSVTPDTAGASETMFRALSAAVIGGTLLAGARAPRSGPCSGRFPGRAARRADARRRQRRLPRLHPRHRDPHRDGGERLRRAGQEGERPWLSITSSPSRRVPGRRPAGRAHREALRAGDRAARRQPAPAEGRGARAARGQRRRQVDADQDHLRLPEAGRGARHRPSGERGRASSRSITRAPWASTASTRTSRSSTS